MNDKDAKFPAATTTIPAMKHDTLATIIIIETKQTTATVIETSATVESAKIISENLALNEATMALTPLINSSSTKISLIDTNNATSLLSIPDADYVFSTRHSQSRFTQATIEDEAPSVIGSNLFTVYETGIFSGFEYGYDIAERARGERHIKPIQKVQKIQWTTIDGRGNCGRGDRCDSGHGP